MRVNEIFYSLQGEGGRAGQPSIFIRLSGCDLTCSFCDTEFESGRVMSLQEIAEHITRPFFCSCRWIVWTGGEPALQLDAEAVAFFKSLGYSQAIETNGAHPVPPGLDWVTVSPKVAEHVLARNFREGVTELRYTRHSGQMALPEPGIPAQYLFLSPLFDGNKPNMENVDHCIKLCLKEPRWRLSVQTHKLLKML